MGTATTDKDYLSEREIISSVVSGSRDNFRYLVAAHQDKVYAMIRRQVGDPHVAGELTQETFVKAYVNLPRFRYESAFSTWLIRIALNVTHTYFRSRRFKEAKKTLPFDAAAEENSPAADPREGASSRDLALLRTAIGKLKPIYREVVVLCCLEGKTYEEASSALQIPRGTVCSRMNTALRLLKEALSQAAV